MPFYRVSILPLAYWIFHVLHSSPIFYMINSLELSYKHVRTSKVKNSVDPDLLASQKPTGLGPHCFLKKRYIRGQHGED